MTQIIKTNCGSRKKIICHYHFFYFGSRKKNVIIAQFFYLKRLYLNANTFKASHGILKITNTVLDALIFVGEKQSAINNSRMDL